MFNSTNETTTITPTQTVINAVRNTIDADGLDSKYPLGPRTFHRPHGSFISNIPGGDSLLPENASDEDVMAVAELLMSLKWTDITSTLNEGQRMGKCRYFEADLPEYLEAYEAACHFSSYLDLIDASESVRKGQEPVPGIIVNVAFHQGPDLSSTVLAPQRTDKIVLSVGASEWKEELCYGSHWHMLPNDPLELPRHAKVLFWAPGSIYPAGQTVKLFRQ